MSPGVAMPLEGTESTNWLQRVESWTSKQFSIAEPDADAVALLRKVADALEQLGNVEVLDITFSNQIEGPSVYSKMTVYFQHAP
jgi:hypothetical protein